MTEPPNPPELLVGLIRIRDHCTFTWKGPAGGRRTFVVGPGHCHECVAELRRRGHEVTSQAESSAKERERK